MYNIFISLYVFFIKLGSLFSEKAREWTKGRKHIFKALKKIEHGDGIIWFHCASLGEYEQGLPVIIKAKEKYPNHKILLTFFSPSGFKNKKHIKLIDYTFYMPADTTVNAYKFVNIVKPVFAVFVKYEFWFNTMSVLKEANIPFIYISCNFRKNQYFFRWYGGWFRQRLRKASHYFVQTQASKDLLEGIRIKQVTISGDTRFDRVKSIADSEYTDNIIEQFIGNSKVFIAGSTWNNDEIIINTAFKTIKDYKLIVAPHVITPENMSRIQFLFNGRSAFYSEYKVNKKGRNPNPDILIIDCIGILSRIYRYADIAYIGGGFGKGIHNILEAAVYGVPVIFGPKYNIYNEAVQLLACGGAYCISNAPELHDILDKFNSNDFLSEAQNACNKYILENLGATDKIIDKINI
ncbi:MAG: glycosyltransferase N-terminal domain-containing protein [Bacteroidales bacterium]|jgi:3-deoxy-D-manno-octulosonic-acid transferase|nr:3-deoxy-D-manno-octulosonic acid transferase [Bacteroidales bacterium]MDD2203805.1 glycosyltransferase N-terminal domain-containing protein [Bacteroidales bacterium]MDD3152916.1 glycosyltransferase N-terminal domain-containing protein [Bacteroidales bacterium]MDD3913256.1 glycosyltransferase N-terminal domain-containing protein [Bacteroidales bacterium]MDD4633287.1 glycosyltransferase N-terminal domain-containing protein [Bacteroidales bacterium]